MIRTNKVVTSVEDDRELLTVTPEEQDAFKLVVMGEPCPDEHADKVLNMFEVLLTTQSTYLQQLRVGAEFCGMSFDESRAFADRAVDLDRRTKPERSQRALERSLRQALINWFAAEPNASP